MKIGSRLLKQAGKLIANEQKAADFYEKLGLKDLADKHRVEVKSLKRLVYSNKNQRVRK